MQILNVEEILANHDAAEPLRLQPLAMLDPRREPYQALICQPGGMVHASPHRIGNADQAAAARMYSALLQEATTRHSQLVVTPEYSVPWSVMDQIVRGSLRPAIGSLWALGFESITPADLEALSGALTKDVRLVHESIDPQRRAQRAFIDPLVYVFWTRTDTNAALLCLLVQFKTVPCRDDDNVELQYLYLGRDVYRFRNNANSIHLVGIVCSDSFEFTEMLVDDNCRDAFLLHIQLNQHPGNPVYSAYRSRLYAVASNDNVEVLSVNWAAGILVEGTAAPWNEIAGSAWYVSPRAGTINDADINQLHHEGVYYSVVDKRWHTFYLNYSPHFLVLEKQRVFSAGPQVLAPRLAPRAVARRVWNERIGAWTDATADDGFGTFLRAYPPLDAALPQMCLQEPLALERAMELLEGTDGSPSDWYTVRQLRALRVADEESLCRFTVGQETDRRRAGVRFRRDRARKAMIAAGFSSQPIAWPTGAADLASGFKFRWTAAEPNCNVEPLNGSRGAATLVFLGDEPEEDALSSIYAKLSKALRADAAQKRAAGASDVDPSHALDRLCVVYRRSNSLKAHRPSDWASITEPDTGGEDDIARGSP
jgi:hypothetical protein